MSTLRTTPPFRFKQFTVEQCHAAMKVGFDGILLGAWSSVHGCQRILDIGTGTGLVALMLAQRTKAEVTDRAELIPIDAIEVDSTAMVDAQQNFANSPWSERLRLIPGRVQVWAETTAQRYDVIVCNPPYFSYSSENLNTSSREVARHDRRLSLGDLFEQAKSLLTESGQLSVIVPTLRLANALESASRVGFVCRRQMRVRALPEKPFYRELLEFRSMQGEVVVEELTVECEHHKYTDEFRSLARDFYLKF